MKKNNKKLTSKELWDYLNEVFKECRKMNKKELIEKIIFLEHALIVAQGKM